MGKINAHDITRHVDKTLLLLSSSIIGSYCECGLWNVTFIAYQIEGHTTFYRTNCLGIHLYTKRDTSFTFLWHFGIFIGKESFHFDMPILLSKVVKLDNTFVSRKRMHFFVESRRQNFCIKWNLIDTLQTFFSLFLYDFVHWNISMSASVCFYLNYQRKNPSQSFTQKLHSRSKAFRNLQSFFKSLSGICQAWKDGRAVVSFLKIELKKVD